MGDYELYHAATRKHKYIKKIGNRYFYTQQEIQAYLEGKKPKSDLTFEKGDYGESAKDERWKKFQDNGGADADTPAEYRKKQRKKATKRVSKHVNKTVKSMKKQSARGKKALQKFYKNNVNPGVTVTYDEVKIK